MMLRYSLGLEKQAQAVEAAVRKVLDGKSSGGFEMRTKDLGGQSTTNEIGDKIISVLKEIL